MKASTKQWVGYTVLLLALIGAGWAIWRLVKKPIDELPDTAPGTNPTSPSPGSTVITPSPATTSRIAAGKTVRMAKQCYLRTSPKQDKTLKNLFGTGIGYPGQIVGAATGKTYSADGITWVECKRSGGELVYVGRACVYGADA